MKVKYRNNAATTLAVAAEVGHTEMTVANASAFPALLLGDWTYVSVEDEVIKVTGINGNVFTCEEFVGAHDINSSVQGRVTVEVLDDAQDVDIYTTPAALPAYGTMRLGELWANAPDRTFGIGDESGNPIKLNAVTVHSSAAKYYLDDVVTYLGGIHKCIVAHTARVFNLTNWDELGKPQTPPGVIFPFIGGYFETGVNDGFVPVHNSASEINALLNIRYGLYVADGASIDVPGSAYYDVAGGSERFLPNLTDDRFLMGSLAAGSVGGSSSMSHSHSMPHTHVGGSHYLSIYEMPPHAHDSKLYDQSGTYPSYKIEGQFLANTLLPGTDTTSIENTGGGGSHNHGNTVSQNTNDTDIGTVIENRPNFLSCHYLVKVI